MLALKVWWTILSYATNTILPEYCWENTHYSQTSVGKKLLIIMLLPTIEMLLTVAMMRRPPTKNLKNTWCCGLSENLFTTPHLVRSIIYLNIYTYNLRESSFLYFKYYFHINILNGNLKWMYIFLFKPITLNIANRLFNVLEVLHGVFGARTDNANIEITV